MTSLIAHGMSCTVASGPGTPPTPAPFPCIADTSLVVATRLGPARTASYCCPCNHPSGLHGARWPLSSRAGARARGSKTVQTRTWPHPAGRMRRERTSRGSWRARGCVPAATLPCCWPPSAATAPSGWPRCARRSCSCCSTWAPAWRHPRGQGGASGVFVAVTALHLLWGRHTSGGGAAYPGTAGAHWLQPRFNTVSPPPRALRSPTRCCRCRTIQHGHALHLKPVPCTRLISGP